MDNFICWTPCMNVFSGTYLLYSHRYRVPAVKRVLVRDSDFFSFLSLFIWFLLFFILLLFFFWNTSSLINARVSTKTMKFNRVFKISLRYCDVKNFKALVARAIITDRDFLVWVMFMWKIILFTSGELSNLE